MPDQQANLQTYAGAYELLSLWNTGEFSKYLLDCVFLICAIVQHHSDCHDFVVEADRFSADFNSNIFSFIDNRVIVYHHTFCAEPFQIAKFSVSKCVFPQRLGLAV